MTAFSLATACKAAGFAYAAYGVPPAMLPREQIGGSTVTYFQDAPETAVYDASLLEASRCSCFPLSEAYERFAFIDNDATGTEAEVWTSASDGVVLSFRGTEVSDPRDVLTDLFFSQRQLGCAVRHAQHVKRQRAQRLWSRHAERE